VSVNGSISRVARVDPFVQVAPRAPDPVRPVQPEIPVETQGLSLRSNFAWVLSGNVVYAICQWGMIVALARLGNSSMVGQFSLGLAIATPILMFSNLHLRAVQATDAQRLYSFGEYLQLRACMTLTALLGISCIVWFGNYEHRTAMVILAVAVAKGIETLNDIHYGLYQLNDRLDQTGKSMMLRGVLSVIALTAGLYLTRNVFWGCVALACVWVVALLLFDVRRARYFVERAGASLPRHLTGKGESRRHWKLLRLALPLGVVTTLATVNLNMPRYFIHARMGARQLGIYSAMAYATVAMTLVSDSLGHCAIPRMSRLFAGGRRADFRSLLLKLMAVGGVLGLAGLATAQLMGSKLLRLFYGAEYAVHSHVFTLLMLAAAIQSVAAMFGSGILSARRFKIQVPILTVVTGCNALVCAWLVPRMGLAGGAMAMVTAATVYLALTGAVVTWVLLPSGGRMAGQREPRFGAGNWEPGI
jgi:O-antigen/teichoic acid export membrane protein